MSGERLNEFVEMWLQKVENFDVPAWIAEIQKWETPRLLSVIITQFEEKGGNFGRVSVMTSLLNSFKKEFDEREGEESFAVICVGIASLSDENFKKLKQATDLNTENISKSLGYKSRQEQGEWCQKITQNAWVLMSSSQKSLTEQFEIFFDSLHSEIPEAFFFLAEAAQSTLGEGVDIANFTNEEFITLFMQLFGSEEVFTIYVSEALNGHPKAALQSFEKSLKEAF